MEEAARRASQHSKIHLCLSTGGVDISSIQGVVVAISAVAIVPILVPSASNRTSSSSSSSSASRIVCLVRVWIASVVRALRLFPFRYQSCTQHRRHPYLISSISRIPRPRILLWAPSIISESAVKHSNGSQMLLAPPVCSRQPPFLPGTPAGRASQNSGPRDPPFSLLIGDRFSVPCPGRG